MLARQHSKENLIQFPVFGYYSLILENEIRRTKILLLTLIEQSDIELSVLSTLVNLKCYHHITSCSKCVCLFQVHMKWFSRRMKNLFPA